MRRKTKTPTELDPPAWVRPLFKRVVTRRQRPADHVVSARSTRRGWARHQATMSPGPSHTRAAGAPSLAVRSRVVAVLELGALLILLSWTFVFPVNGEPQGSFERLMEAVGKSPKRHGDLEDDIDDGRYARPRRSFERSYDLDDGRYARPRRIFERSDDLDDAGGFREPADSFQRLVARAPPPESSSPIKRTKPADMDGSYRAYYMNDYCNAGQKALPVHLQLHSDQAGVILYSHRRNSTPRSSICQLPFQVENAAKFTLSFRFFDTVSDSFMCFMYLEARSVAFGYCVLSHSML
ncbi:uncharacterized protein LOC142768424 [Rhipicephalus microplus]|uniref:uncharacterized protein LOC142768424 n=1 Tax=Rhipicephalus microplus TaxID=6941 RepID=UPI003F6BBFD5